MTHPPSNGSLEKRVSRIEDKLDEVSESVGQAVRMLTEKISQARQPNFGVIWAGLGVAVATVAALFTAFSSGYWRDQDRIDKTLDVLGRSFVEHIKDGHPRRVEEQTVRNAEKIEALDVTLQREMRILDESADARVRGITSQLHQDLAEHKANARRERDEIARRVTLLESWRLGMGAPAGTR